MPSNDSARAPGQQRSVVLTPAARRYLKERGFSEADQSDLMTSGLLELCTFEDAKRLVGEKPDMAEYDEFLWLPRREPTGNIVREHGHLVMLKLAYNGFLKADVLKRKPTNPPAELSPNHASFYGDNWYGYSGEVIVHESAIKAQLEHLKTGAMTIGLNGINGLTYKENGESYYLLEFAAPPWDKSATVAICFDSPNKTSLKSAQHLKEAKLKLVQLLGEHTATIYDRSVPPPEDNRIARDICDYVVEIGDEAFSHLSKHRKLLYTRPLISGDLLLSAAEVAAQEPPNWLVHDIIATNELTAVYGETSCGKSFLTMDLLLAVATDRPHWFNHAIRQRGLTVHVTLEGAGMPLRLRAYQERYSPESLDNHKLINQQLDFKDPDSVDRVIEAIAAEDTPLAAIAIDTVNRAMSGGDENSSVDMGLFLAQAERIRSAFPTAAVLLVHHSGKGKGRGLRGHSSLAANVGGIIEVKRDKVDKNLHSLLIEKQREGKALYTLSHFKLDVLELGADTYGDVISSCVVAPVAPPVEPEKDSYGALYEIWTEKGSKPVPKSWFLGEARRKLRDEFGIELSRLKMERYFSEVLVGGGGLLIDQGRGAGGGIHYMLSEPRKVKY